MLVLLMLAAALRAATPPPANFVADDATLFTQDAAATLSATLRGASKKLGVSLYVVTYPFLPVGETVRERATQLADEWCQEKPGVVIVVNRGNLQAHLVASPALWRRYPPDETVVAFGAATTLLAQPTLSPEERVQQAVATILQHLVKMENVRQARARPFARSEAHLAEAFALVLLGMACVTWLLVSLWRRRQARRAAVYFPDVEVGTRLGAPFGGGVIGVAGEKQ